MFLGSFLIGLREGLEASLIIGILIAYVRRQGRSDVVSRIWLGVGIAVLGAVALGALFTFGRYGLSFEGQELLGGGMSLLAVVMVTWMVFWMLRMGRGMKAELEASAATAIGSGWGMFWLAFISVGREGIETTLMLWAWLTEPIALFGAIAGLLVACGMGYLIHAGMLRIKFSTFFAWTGTLLIIMTAGILAYGIHDLQEARFLPGPFSGAPITPIDLRTKEVLVGFFTERPFWGAAYPFGWAFDVQDVIPPDSWLAALLKGTVGFTPLMSWLEITAWALYLGIVLPLFIKRVRPRKENHVNAHSA
ncbi:MAG: iron uptake transporter permease EfeU [Propionibacteriaceae bacterium]|nr:iron uptake transporter permease EfeU [Propionibacteriaceae bacterium]